ncbi:MAG: phosphate signaling complex protein PhoU [Eubacteriales bacterium]|nr:phosphate signaling complex protein PhoU [Eubacteriales bacterium]
MRSRLDEELALLNRELIRMGAQCEEAIATAARALREADTDLAARIPPMEKAIDARERDVETLCMKLLLQQQPVARDLRQISAALKMITDLERIGDQSSDISEIIGYLGGRRMEQFDLVDDMADATIHMVTESVDAFVKQDVSIAYDVIKYDDVVDSKFVEIKQSLIQLLGTHPDAGEYAIDLLMIAKYFERIGDHAVNVAEWVVYSITGIHKGENIEA